MNYHDSDNDYDKPKAADAIRGVFLTLIAAGSASIAFYVLGEISGARNLDIWTIAISFLGLIALEVWLRFRSRNRGRHE